MIITPMKRPTLKEIIHHINYQTISKLTEPDFLGIILFRSDSFKPDGWCCINWTEENNTYHYEIKPYKISKDDVFSMNEKEFEKIISQIECEYKQKLISLELNDLEKEFEC